MLDLWCYDGKRYIRGHRLRVEVQTIGVVEPRFYGDEVERVGCGLGASKESRFRCPGESEMNFGKCGECGDPIITREYKVRGGRNNFRRLYRCKKSVAHSYTDAQLNEMDIDIDYYKKKLSGAVTLENHD